MRGGAHRGDLLAAHGAKPDEPLVRMLGRVLMLGSSLDARLLGTAALPPGTNGPLLDAIRADKEAAALLIDHVVPHLQRRALEDRYRMKTGEMLRVMERYGPLDWRHADAHGVYWSEQGVAVSQTLARREAVNELMLVRSRLLMLMELMRSGRVEFDAATKRVDLLPDPRFARVYETAIRQAFDMIASDKGLSAADFGNAEEADLHDTYEKFLNLATILNYLYGEQAEAERYFGLARDFAASRGFGDEPVYSDTLENFVALRFAGTVQVNLADLRQFLDAMIRRAIMEGLAKGELKVFNRYIRVAYSVYDRRFATSRPGERMVLEEAKLLDFPELVENSFVNVMQQTGLPVLARARIWAWTPEKLRQATYATLAEGLRSEAEVAGLDPQLAFPPPPKADKPAADDTAAPATTPDEPDSAGN